MDNQEEMRFEDRLEAVQNMIGRIEGGQLSREDSVKQYEEGMKILAELDRKLGEMNRRLTVLRDGKETELEA